MADDRAGRLHKELEQSEKELEQQNTLLSQQNKKLNERVEELEKKIKQLKKEPLIKHYVELQEELWEIEKCEPYSQFFKRIANSLQILIGMAEAMEALNDEKKDYYMWDMVAQPLARAIEDMHGEFRDGKLILPLPQAARQHKEKIEREDEKARAAESAVLAQWIEEDESRKAQGKILLQKRKIIWGLAEDVIMPIQQLLEWKEKGEFDWEQGRNSEWPVRLAVAVRVILKNNGIYPLFASDERLEGEQGLKNRFMQLKKNAIRYPGLFIKYGKGTGWDGGGDDVEWEVLGAHIGMDDRGEKTLKKEGE